MYHSGQIHYTYCRSYPLSPSKLLCVGDRHFTALRDTFAVQKKKYPGPLTRLHALDVR